MVSGSLAPLYTVFQLQLGCSGAAATIGNKVLQNGEIFYSSIRPSVDLPVHPSILLMMGRLAPKSAWLALRPGWLGLRPAWQGLRPAWLAIGPPRGEWMDEWTENLPILQDFIPYRGRCPKTIRVLGERYKLPEQPLNHLFSSLQSTLKQKGKQQPLLGHPLLITKCLA